MPYMPLACVLSNVAHIWSCVHSALESNPRCTKRFVFERQTPLVLAPLKMASIHAMGRYLAGWQMDVAGCGRPVCPDKARCRGLVDLRNGKQQARHTCIFTIALKTLRKLQSLQLSIAIRSVSICSMGSDGMAAGSWMAGV